MGSACFINLSVGDFSPSSALFYSCLLVVEILIISMHHLDASRKLCMGSTGLFSTVLKCRRAHMIEDSKHMHLLHDVSLSRSNFVPAPSFTRLAPWRMHVHTENSSWKTNAFLFTYEGCFRKVGGKSVKY